MDLFHRETLIRMLEILIASIISLSPLPHSSSVPPSIPPSAHKLSSQAKGKVWFVTKQRFTIHLFSSQTVCKHESGFYTWMGSCEQKQTINYSNLGGFTNSTLTVNLGALSIDMNTFGVALSPSSPSPAAFVCLCLSRERVSYEAVIIFDFLHNELGHQQPRGGGGAESSPG